ncbi:MAG: bifunctional DNA-formamidopyrimidine glycosylase/DNA-(apurinic or apyrimidinic site) lyase [Parcubacteria group bacterium]
MPELPEVENTARSLKRLVVGRRIKDVWTNTPKLIRKGSFEELKEGVKGREITNVQRRAKNIIISLSGGYALLIHLKMTGHLLIGKWNIEKEEGKEIAVSLLKGALSEKVNGYIHVIFYLDDGRELALSDLRKFAKLIFGKEEEIRKEKGIYDAGTEATEMNSNEFHSVISGSRKHIKSLLMDQTKIAGIGNIYSDDILFKAKIHPLRPAASLTEKEIAKLYDAMKDILALAVKLGGTSISDFRTLEGKEGGYAEKRLVYRRDGKPCPRCGTSIKRIKIGSRSARFCPSCQKL